MAQRVSSPTLVGREHDLAALSAAIEAGRVVLVSGDAGIGKTRLVDEAAAHAVAGGMLVAVGGCIQLGEASVPYAPLTEALRAIRREIGPEAFAAVAADDVAGLLDGQAADEPGSSAAVFGHLLGLFTQLGAQRRLVVVFEDMHWADASTRDLVAFLARNLTDAATSLVLTYRADDVHRRHPLRELLSQLERAPAVERIDLGGLSRADLTGLIAQLTSGADTAPETVDELLDRTGGNPFFLEELVAAGRLGGLPASLADVILDRVAKLSDEAQLVLHRAAVLGLDVDDSLLAEVTGRTLEDVAAALREAVAAQVLSLDADGCRFRHALLAEALYDDLLPGTREALHQRAAEVLEDSDRYAEHVRWALLAHHWDAAREPVKAFIAAAKAGRAAEGVYAVADAAAQYERALELFDRVPDAEALIGMDRADLLATTSQMLSASSLSSRAPDLMRAAVDALDADSSPERRAEMLVRLGRVEWTHGNPAALDAHEQAMALVEDRPPSREQAAVLAQRARMMLINDRFADAEPAARRAIEVATQVGADDVHAHALNTQGVALVMQGRHEDGIAAGWEALTLGMHASPREEVVAHYINLGETLRLTSRHEEAIQVDRDGLQYASKVGFERGNGLALAGNLIGTLITAGRWDEAHAIYADLPAVDGLPQFLTEQWLALPLARGELTTVAEHLDRVLQATEAERSSAGRGQALTYAMRLAAASARWAEARAHLEEFMALIDGPHDNFYTGAGLSEASRVEADRALTLGDLDPEMEVRLADRIARFRTEWADRMLPVTPVRLEEAEAHLARLRGQDSPHQWATIVDGFDELGHPVEAAWARVWLADATLRNGASRDEAADALGLALATAERLGATRMAEQAQDLARRGRLTLGQRAAAPPSEGLTPREVDVLRLVAAGKTNREIGEELFISDKTVSVHVTNLLRKLDVTSRREAADIARHRGLT